MSSPCSTRQASLKLILLVMIGAVTRLGLRRRPGKRWTPRPALQWVLDKFTAPAIIRNGRMDLLASNHLGRTMHAALYEQPNFARFTFLNLDAAHDFYPDWDSAADTCVAILRTEAGRDPHDKDLHDLVGELSTAATTSDAAGVPTTSAITAPAPSTFTTTTLATWNSLTRAST
jgi:hypothetical protein